MIYKYKKIIGKITKYSAIFMLVLPVVFFSIFDIGKFEKAEAGINPDENEYIASIGPVIGSTSANYVFASMYNPVGSGKTAIISRIRIGVDAAAAANYTNMTLRRISAVSSGTVIDPTNIPKKNSDSVNTLMDIRYANGVGGVVFTAGTGVNSRINTVNAPGVVGAYIGKDELVFSDNEKLILKPGEGIALYQEAAGDVDHRVRLTATWEEVTSTPSAQNEYIMSYPRVENVAAADYKYNTFFNPASSGKTAIIKRLALDVDADAAVTGLNDIYIRRISAASAGTLIANADIPKKNTNSVNSIIEARYLGVTATLSGTVDSKMMLVHPLTAASQPQSHLEWLPESDDEDIIIKPGEGIAVVSSAAGDVDQLVRMSVVWSEQSLVPVSKGEYMLSSPSVAGTTTSGQNFVSFYNPASSGKTAVVKRIGARVDWGATGTTYTPMTVQRFAVVPSGGTTISVVNIPKKNTSTADSIMDVRSGSITISSKSGGVNARLLSVIGPGATGQLIGQKEIVFGEENLILKPGEGVVLYQESAGHTGHRIKMYMEWSEVSVSPASLGGYNMTIGPISGATTNPYNYATVFNPSASGKTMVIKRVGMRVDTVAAGVYVPLSIKRLTTSAPTGGTLVTNTDIPKKNTSTANSIAEIRTIPTAASVILKDGTTNTQPLLSGTTPGAIGSATAIQLSGYEESNFSTYENLILQPGEGLVIRQEGTGDADLRVKLDLEWDEEIVTPVSQGEYALTIPVSGSTTADYVYSTLYNPDTSSEDIVVKRLGLSVDAAAAAVYIPMTLRKIVASSGGTQILSSYVPKKNSNTADSTLDIRTTNPTVEYTDSSEARIMSRTTPGAVGQAVGSVELVFIQGDELILHPGEGIALYQEGSGDVDFRTFLKVVWSRVPINLAAITPTRFDSPFRAQETPDQTPDFDFISSDPDGTAGIVYQIQISSDYNFSSIIIDCTSDSACITGTGVFINTINGSDTSPFTENQKVRFTPTTMLANSSPNTAYFWRVRAQDSIDEGGSGFSSSYNSISSFRVNTSLLTSQFVQTTDNQFNQNILNSTSVDVGNHRVQLRTASTTSYLLDGDSHIAYDNDNLDAGEGIPPSNWNSIGSIGDNCVSPNIDSDEVSGVKPFAYQYMSTDDNIAFQTRGTTGDYSCIGSNYVVTEDASIISNIGIFSNSWRQTAGNIQYYIKNWTTGNYDNIATINITSTSSPGQNDTVNITSGFSDYVDIDGNLRLVYIVDTVNTDWYIDLLRLDISTVAATTGSTRSVPVDYDWVPGMVSWGTANWTEDETKGSIYARIWYTSSPISTFCDTVIPDTDLPGNGVGFASGPIDLSGLNTTTYNRICMRAIFTNSGGTPYLNDWTVTWSNVSVTRPVVTTQAVSNIMATSAVGAGNITNTGGENNNLRGIVYHTSSHGDPGNIAPLSSLYSSKTEETGVFGAGSFSENIISLTTGLTYYVRAYSHNSAGYSYGGEVSFVATPPLLSVGGILTSSVYDTTSNTTSIGYNSIMWKGSLGGNGLNEGKVRFQLAASSSPTGPWNYYGGSTCGSSDWFDPQGPNNPIELKGSNCFSSWNNKRYYRYKVQICSNDCVTGGPNTPIINNVIVNWAP